MCLQDHSSPVRGLPGLGRMGGAVLRRVIHFAGFELMGIIGMAQFPFLDLFGSMLADDGEETRLRAGIMNRCLQWEDFFLPRCYCVVGIFNFAQLSYNDIAGELNCKLS